MKPATFALVIAAVLGWSAGVYFFVAGRSHQHQARVLQEDLQKTSDQNGLLSEQLDKLQEDLDAAKAVLGEKELELLKLREPQQ